MRSQQFTSPSLQATTPLATMAALAGGAMRDAAISGKVDALAAQVAALAAQVAALAAQVAALPTLVQLQSLVATGAATAHAIAQARAQNSRNHSGAPYAVVPLADGTLPLAWPAAALDRLTLATLSMPRIDALLNAYGEPIVGVPRDRRLALARYIGAISF